MRMCHRDLSPENVILLDNTSLVIDFGMCLRIPYSKDGMTYSEHGTMMHRTRRKHPCGKAVRFDCICLIFLQTITSECKLMCMLYLPSYTATHVTRTLVGERL